MVRFSVYIFWPSVLSLNNLKIHKTKAVKNICIQEKFRLQLTFNPGLALTGFRTTRPCLQQVTVKYPLSICQMMEESATCTLTSFQSC